MKLYRVLLLIVFICATLFIGVVGNILANRNQNAYWFAEAQAWRSGGLNNDRLHVNMWGSAECTARARSTELEISFKIFGKPELNEFYEKIIYHGSGNLVRNFKSHYQDNSGEAHVTSTGIYQQVFVLQAVSTDRVGVMPPPPPPPDPIPPLPIEDCPCDTVGIESVNGLYTAKPGESHEACVMTDAPFYEILWYVAAPGETGLGTNIEVDTGDGTTTNASFSYTFPSGAMHIGTYKITAYIYRWNQSAYEESYTVDVALP
ncbi:hypothetical protein F4083_13015 [Candidatus Poribacteria bacterium]|nr:hypothetical protein [Candidatus Poribacteria bacterium]MYI95216.1 hypothetical protein [Candidatus Poribacteria bacterium]